LISAHFVILKSKSILVDNLLKKETAEMEKGIAGKSKWDHANIPQKLGLVWFGETERKLAKILKTSFTYLSSLVPAAAGATGHSNLLCPQPTFSAFLAM
jgi:hypothetical protein